MRGIMKKKFLKLDYETKLYITLVSIIFFIVYGTILLSGKMYMYVDIGADTFCSYWPSIAYVKNLLTDLKLWDMKLGLGAPTATYFSFFLSDPFNWICFLFKNENMDIGLWIGVAFKYLFLSYYSYQYIGIKNITGRSRTISALMLTFSGWFVGWGQHYHFATAFLLFIALLFYFECWMRDGKYIRLILSVMLLAMIMPYYCYMSLLFLVFYYFVSLCFLYIEKRISFKNVLFHSVKTACVIIMGLLCSAVIFLPWAAETLSSPRVGGQIKPSLVLGNLQEYLSIIMRLFSNSIMGVNINFAGYSNFYESPFMYIGILFVLIAPFFLFNKRNIKKYWLIITLVVFSFLFVNSSSIIFSAFSAKVYRWTYLFVPIFALMCGKCLEYNFYNYDKRIVIIEGLFWNIILAFYGYWYYNQFGSSRSVMISLAIVFVIMNSYIAVMLFVNNRQVFNKILVSLVAIDLCSNAFITVNGRGMVEQSEKLVMGYFDDSNEAIEYLKYTDSDFYRISKKYNQIDLNDSMFQNYNGEKLYSSVLSGDMWNMMSLFDLRIQNSAYFYGFDDKQILRNLTVGKYRLTKAPNQYYGYQQINNTGDVYIYENKNCANFGTLYDSYVLESDLQEKSEFEKQTCLLYNCVINDADYDNSIKSIGKNLDFENIEMQLVQDLDNIRPDKTSIMLDFENTEPMLLEISGTDSKGNIEIITRENKEYTPDLLEFTIKDGLKTYYIDNLNIKKIRINRSEGVISYVKLYQIDSKELDVKSENLKSESLTISQFSDSKITGHTNCKEDKILLIPVSYNKNWNVFINGETTKTYRADAGLMAVIVPKGYSEIIIKYESKYFYIGCFVTCSSFIGLLIVAVFTRKKRRK